MGALEDDANLIETVVIQGNFGDDESLKSVDYL